VYNGDVVSMLYTNSSAMHSGLMREFSDNVSSAPINAIVVSSIQYIFPAHDTWIYSLFSYLKAIKRRFQNVVNDPSRQAQYEMILGIQK
jgi:hypothetical protein